MRFTALPVFMLLTTGLPSIGMQSRDKVLEKVLKAAKEPAVVSGLGQPSGYRMVWLRTFEAPFVVRVWKQGRDYRVRVVLLTGQSGFEIGSIREDRQFKITKDAWEALVSELNALGFSSEFRLPGDPNQDLSIKVAADGSTTHFESNHGPAGVSFSVQNPDPIGSRSEARSLQAIRLFVTLAATRTPTFY